MSGATRDASESREPCGEVASLSGPDAVTGQSSGSESGLYEAFLAHFPRGQSQVQAFKLPERQRHLVSLFYGQQLPAEPDGLRRSHVGWKSLTAPTHLSCFIV